MKVSIAWFRRDLRLQDNMAFAKAMDSNYPVLPLFIFDNEILSRLPKEDARVSFIHQTLTSMHDELGAFDSSILVMKGNPKEVWQKLLKQYDVQEVYWNRDYSPYALQRDSEIEQLLQKNKTSFFNFKDHVVFEKNEIAKSDGSPYLKFSAFKNKWLHKFVTNPPAQPLTISLANLLPVQLQFPSLEEIGFKKSSLKVKDFDLSKLHDYNINRDYPSIGTSNLGPHLRFGTKSIRGILKSLNDDNDSFLNELIWREFFQHIMFNFPRSQYESFNVQYRDMKFLDNKKEFKRWCEGQTGYPMVDAGMRELNETGYMHNRVRMITAGFLCKHLLIDWRWGAKYFSFKLMDYEMSSNIGNWQWASGTGCDAAPYFRIFNPETQQKRFDKEFEYIKKWIPEFGTEEYVKPIIDHKFARERAIDWYKSARSIIKNNNNEL